MKLLKATFLSLFITLASACAVIAHVPVTSITLNETSFNLPVGESKQLVAIVSPSNATDSTVTWSVNNDHVSLSNDGLVKGLSVGQCTVTCKSNDDKSILAKCSIKVTSSNIPVTSLTFDKTEGETYAGNQVTITPTILPNNATNKKLTWTSSDSKIATVNNGVVSTFDIGNATITAKTTDGSDITATYNLLVKEFVAVTSVTILKSGTPITESNLYIEQTIGLTTDIQPTNASDKTIIWSSSNTSVATVNEGTVQGLSEGTSKIKALNENSGLYSEITVNVSFDPEQKVYLPSVYYGDYYSNDFSWSNGVDLQRKLFDLMQLKRTDILKYNSPTNWSTNKEADHSEYDFEMLDVVYSSQDVYVNDTNTGWQREHAFPASLMTGLSTGQAVDNAKYKDRANDFQALFAAARAGNQSRSNKNLGVSTNPTGSIGDCKYDTKNFEPNNKDKGRLARALFYMATMNGYVEVEPLKLQEAYVEYDGSTNPAAHGNLSSLLLWANTYNVDRLEVQHNNSVATSSVSGKCQGNRNVFVDYPQLVDYIYGAKKNTSGKLKLLAPSIYTLDMLSNSEYYNFAIKTARRTYSVGETYSISSDLTLVNVMKNNTNTNVNYNTGYFTLSGVNDGYVFTNSDKGKTFTVNITKSNSNPYSYSKSNTAISYSFTVN